VVGNRRPPCSLSGGKALWHSVYAEVRFGAPSVNKNVAAFAHYVRSGERCTEAAPATSETLWEIGGGKCSTEGRTKKQEL